jgi:hypothetical protein
LEPKNEALCHDEFRHFLSGKEGTTELIIEAVRTIENDKLVEKELKHMFYK